MLFSNLTPDGGTLAGICGSHALKDRKHCTHRIPLGTIMKCCSCLPYQARRMFLVLHQETARTARGRSALVLGGEIYQEYFPRTVPVPAGDLRWPYTGPEHLPGHCVHAQGPVVRCLCHTHACSNRSLPSISREKRRTTPQCQESRGP